MNIKVRKDGDVVLLDIDESRLDVSNAELFKARFAELAGEGERFVIDVGRVQSIDTYGIGALLWCWMKLNAVQGALRITSPTDSVREVLELVKVSDILDVGGADGMAAGNPDDEDAAGEP